MLALPSTIPGLLSYPAEAEGKFGAERRKALQLVLWATLLISATLAVITWLILYIPTFCSMLTMAVISLGCLVLNGLGRQRLAAALFSAGLLLIVLINSYFGEGIHDIATLALPVVIITAGLFYGRTAVPWYTLLTMISLGLTAFLPNLHQLYGAKAEDTVIGSILLGGTGIVVYFTMKRLEDHIAEVKKSQVEVSAAYEASLEAWAKMLEMRDRETESHSRMVTLLTVELARHLGINDPAQLTHMRHGALLHDIGKIGIPDAILLKPGPLTDIEWQVMKRHTLFASTVLADIDYLQPACDLVVHHHEHWDGSGYPAGLRGEEIPLGARIFAVVDNWDALRSDRPYREAWPREKVKSYLQENAGTLFDPAIVKSFLEMVEEDHV